MFVGKFAFIFQFLHTNVEAVEGIKICAGRPEHE